MAHPRDRRARREAEPRLTGHGRSGLVATAVADREDTGVQVVEERQRSRIRRKSGTMIASSSGRFHERDLLDDMNESEEIRVVIAERGGDWAALAEESRGLPTLLLLQQAEERIEDFVSRVRDKISRVITGGRRIREAAIVGGGRADLPAMSARSLMIRLLTTPMVASGGGRVFLVSAGPERLGMMGLLTTVTPMLEGTQVTLEAVHGSTGASTQAA